MDNIEENIKELEKVRLQLESIKEKLNSSVMSDNKSTITSINYKLMEVIDELNSFNEINKEELNKMKENN